MNPEEAIERLRGYIDFNKENKNKLINIDIPEQRIKEEISVWEAAIQALEKQVAIKPVIAESAPSYVLGKKVYTEYKACGVCGDVVGGGCAENSNYCSECGYKIDWSEE